MPGKVKMLYDRGVGAADWSTNAGNAISKNAADISQSGGGHTNSMRGPLVDLTPWDYLVMEVSHIDGYGGPASEVPQYSSSHLLAALSTPGDATSTATTRLATEWPGYDYAKRLAALDVAAVNASRYPALSMSWGGGYTGVVYLHRAFLLKF